MLILKQLRRKKNMSQTDLAEAIGVSLRTIQLYEKKNANIPIKNLNRIANYFEMGIDQLYAKEVNESDTTYNKANIVSKKGHSIRKLAPGKYLVTVPLVTERESVEYCINYENQEFINDLVHISFVIDQVSVARYLAFEISNNSMHNEYVNGIPKKSIVLGKKVSKKELVKRIENKNTFWIIVYKETIMCKQITAYDKKKNTINCHSLNKSPEYPDFNISMEEVKEFFLILKKEVA